MAETSVTVTLTVTVTLLLVTVTQIFDLALHFGGNCNANLWFGSQVGDLRYIFTGNCPREIFHKNG